MMTLADVKIGDKWLVADYGFIFNDKEISLPEPKTTIIDIPGTSDAVDLTEEISGDVQYARRKIRLILEDGSGKDSYYGRISELANDIHGQKKKIVFSRDAGFYWIGRLAVEAATPKHYGTTFVVTAIVDPYKYEVHDSLTPWDDSVSNAGEIIREYFDIVTPGTLTIVGRRKPVIPIFHCSAAMTVTYNGNTYNLLEGENRIPTIILGLGNHILTFSGAGTVSVAYRGGSL